ncbi:MAG: MlaD family protein [Campylobacterota bacterium]|nr:MlaD family protein [Campylobacterota bacterium]
MNNRVNYTFVGILVLAGMLSIIGFAYWMLKPTTDSDVQNYTIYFDESVLGLNLDAPVKYRGISVGKVANMKINPKNSEQVQVTVSILKSTPIKVNTLAKLTAQGITGLTYINLSMGGQMNKHLEHQEGEEYPVISTTPSFFENFEKSLGSVSSKLSSTLGGTEQLLGEDNQEQMALLLKRSASVMEKVDRVLDDESINHLNSIIANTDSFTRKLDNLVPDINKLVDASMKWEDNISGSLDSIQVSYKGISASMAEFKRAVSSGEFNLKELGSDVVPTMNNTFLELQGLLIQLESTLKQYDESPADILYKRQEIKKAPGEK